MAYGFWIESHQSLDRHPKLIKSATALGVKRPLLIGHLHLLWHWALDFAQDGDVSGYEPAELAMAAEWEGDAGAFVEALTNCGKAGGAGFLEITDDGRTVLHDWYDYAGKLIEMRKANAQRMREKRATHVHRTFTARAGATLKDQTVNNQTVKQTESLNQEGESVNAHADARTRGEQPQTVAAVEPVTAAAAAPAPAPAPVAKATPEAAQTTGWENSRTRPAPKPNGKSPPALSGAAREELALYEHLLSSAADILADRLSPAQSNVLRAWFDDWKGRGLTREIVSYAERETAAHTTDPSLEYFFRVMQRKIEHPDDERRAANGSKANGAHKQNNKASAAAATAGSKFSDRSGLADLVAQRASGPPKAQSP